MERERFDEHMQRSIDFFVDSFRMASNDRERQSTNQCALDYIQNVCSNNKMPYEPYKDQYLDKVRGD